MKKIALILFLFLLNNSLFSQGLISFDQSVNEKKLIGLKQSQKIAFVDTLISKLRSSGPEVSIKVLNFAIQTALQNEFPRTILGSYYWRRGQEYRDCRKLSLSIQDLLKSEDIFLSINNKQGLMQVCLAFANTYISASDNVKAIKFALRAQTYALELKNGENLTNVYNTLANLYKMQGQINKAKQFYLKSLALLNGHPNKRKEAFLLDNLAILILDSNPNEIQLDSAKLFSDRAMDIAKAKNDKELELQLLPSASSVAEKQKKYELQLKLSERGVFLADSLKLDAYLAYLNLNVGSALINNNLPQKAIPIFEKSVAELKAYNDYYALETVYGEISRAFEMMNKYDSANHYFKLHKQTTDTLNEIRAKDQVNELLVKLELDQKEEKISNLNNLNKALAEKNKLSKEKDKLKSIILYGAACLLVIILILLVITYKRFKDNKKLSKEISIKNLALVTKNNEITDSITYAKRIQQALLPSANELLIHFPQSFIYFKPKDIVSGDFYWTHAVGDLVFVAVGDCTGHGVPGGFMSMLGHSFLNQIVNEKHVYEPAQVLNQLRQKVISSLRQTGAPGENKDGMDITFLAINKNKMTLSYAAANNTFYLIRDGISTEYKADKQPIGYYSNVLKDFSETTISIQKKDSIYLFSDGYPDQFGGKSNVRGGKKLKHSVLQKMLVQQANSPMSDQKILLENFFLDWKGNYEQTDDVCLMGIRI